MIGRSTYVGGAFGRGWSTVRLLGWALAAGFAAGNGCASPAGNSFASPDAAAAAMVSAVREDDTAKLNRVLGPDGGQLFRSGDDVEDAQRRAEFLAAYDQNHRLTQVRDGVVALEVGPTDWPMPLPIMRGEKGWRFDTDAGVAEILCRRIGRNELDAIQVALAIVDAQREYALSGPDADGGREYAQKIASDPGRRNGLYWPTAEGQPPSPLGALVADATVEGYSQATTLEGGPRPYHGYFYRILLAQGENATGGVRPYVRNGRMTGGFGVVAWPAEYGISGVKTFIVNHEGVVYEADLGNQTDTVAESMTEFDPGQGWTEVAQPPAKRGVFVAM